jgi:hypothetical protein
LIFNGSKFWHFCDIKEIEIWKNLTRRIKKHTEERNHIYEKVYCECEFGYCVVNIIKTIHNNHKFCVLHVLRNGVNEKWKIMFEKEKIESKKNFEVWAGTENFGNF